MRQKSAEAKQKSGGVKQKPTEEKQKPVETPTIAPEVRVPAGTFDGFAGMTAAGWCWDPNAPERRLEAVLEIDGEPALRMQAELFRQDLLDDHIGDGRHGFLFELPETLRDGAVHAVGVRLAETGQALSCSPRNFCTHFLVDVSRFEAERPWIDMPEAEQVVLEQFHAGALSYRLARDLLFWHREGYVIFKGEIPLELLDRCCADFDATLAERVGMQFQPPGHPPTWLSDWDGPVAFENTRFLEFHTISEAAAEIAMSPRIVEFCRAVFADTPVAMQSLHFVMGSTQRAHMDFPYVHTPKPAFLTASWVPLEDVHEDAGPLFYYPRSHRLVPKFDFGGGNLLAYGDGWHVRNFEEYLQGTCERLGLERKLLLPQRGDVLIWHSALVHGGSPRNDPQRTRRSLVTHYSGAGIYNRDRRYPDRPPLAVERNGGLYYDLQEPGYPSRHFKLDPLLRAA